MNKRLAKALIETAQKPGLSLVAAIIKLPNGEWREKLNTALPLPEQIELIADHDEVEVHFAGTVEGKKSHCAITYRDGALHGATVLENMIAEQTLALEEEWLCERYVKAARERHHRDGECEIDDNASVSFGDSGGYVQAWVWVDGSELGEEDGE